jgi:CHAD domain-containing protein
LSSAPRSDRKLHDNNTEDSTAMRVAVRRLPKDVVASAAVLGMEETNAFRKGDEISDRLLDPMGKDW